MNWIEVIIDIEEGIVAVFRVVIKGDPVVRELGGLKSVGVVSRGACLIAPNKGTKSLFLGMVSQELGKEIVQPSGSPEAVHSWHKLVFPPFNTTLTP